MFKDSVSKEYDSTLVNFSKLQKNNIDTVKSRLIQSQSQTGFKDEVVAKVHPAYDSVSQLKRFFLGDNYRKARATSVQMKVFDIQKQNGGFTIDGIGGGKQTVTLRLLDKNDKEWILRSINKNPSLALPENQRGIVAKPIVQDMISAAQPYAPLAIADLAHPLMCPKLHLNYFMCRMILHWGFIVQNFLTR